MTALTDLQRKYHSGRGITPLEFAALSDGTGEAAAELERLQAIERLARFIVLNRRNFTIGDTDGVASATIDKLAAALEQK